MDSNNFLQYLIPGIFLIVWAIGKIFGGKKEEAQPRDVAKVKVIPVDSFEDSAYELDDFGSIKLPSKPQTVVASTSLKHYKGAEKHQQTAPIKVIKSTALPTVVSYKKLEKRREHLELLALLQNSHSVKRAFLTSEILGSPIALRQNGKTGPRWEQ